MYVYVSVHNMATPKVFFFSSLNKKVIDNLYTNSCCWIIHVSNGLNHGLWWIIIFEVFVENLSEMFLFILSLCYCDGSSFASGSNSIVDVFDKTLSCKVIDAIITSSLPWCLNQYWSFARRVELVYMDVFDTKCSSMMLSMLLCIMDHLAWCCWTHYGCLWLKTFLWCY